MPPPAGTAGEAVGEGVAGQGVGRGTADDVLDVDQGVFGDPAEDASEDVAAFPGSELWVTAARSVGVSGESPETARGSRAPPGVPGGCVTQERAASTLGYFKNHCSLRRGSMGTSARSE